MRAARMARPEILVEAGWLLYLKISNRAARPALGRRAGTRNHRLRPTGLQAIY
jgi:hypothetical protein